MGIIGEWLRRLGFLLRRRAMEDDLRREMEAHRAMMGDPRGFGNTLRLRDEARDAWGWRLARQPGARHPVCVADPASQSGVHAHRDHHPGVRHRRQHRHVTSRQRPAVAAVVRTPRRSRRGLQPRSTKPDGGSRGLSYPNYLDLREGTPTVFAESRGLVVALRRSGRGRGRTTHDRVRA